MKKVINTFIFIAVFLCAAHAQLQPDRHTTSPSDAWLSCAPSMNPNLDLGSNHWAMFDFGAIHQLTVIKLWNHNDPSSLNNGIQDLQIHTSLDKITWTDQGIVTVPISDGSAFYEGVDVLNLNGTFGRFVLLTAVSNYGGACYGLAEARYYIGQAVPIELASFEGACDNNKQALRWTFADISDFGSVTVEKSTDGKEWRSIYSTSNPGIGGANGTYENSYEDESRNADMQLYRLQMMDINGDIKYSNMIELSCGIAKNDFNVFPNPVGKQLVVSLDLLQSKLLTYTIKDIVGKTVLAGEFEANQGANQFDINTSTLVDGSYYISIDLGNELIEKKILKLNP